MPKDGRGLGFTKPEGIRNWGDGIDVEAATLPIEIVGRKVCPKVLAVGNPEGRLTNGAATLLGVIAVRALLVVMPALVDSESGGRFSGTDGRRISE